MVELSGNKSKCVLEEEGAVAQLIERRIRIAEARGLNPLSSTITALRMKIVAIGGYKSENVRKGVFDSPIIIDKKIVALSGKKRPNVLFISTASSDYEGYIEAFCKIYQKRLHCPVDTLEVVRNRLSKKAITEKIRLADVIYVGGGNTLKMMKKWHRLGIDAMLKQ